MCRHRICFSSLLALLLHTIFVFAVPLPPAVGDRGHFGCPPAPATVSLSTSQRSEAKRPAVGKKVALLFLVAGRVSHAGIWEEWLKAGEDLGVVSAYTHFTPRDEVAEEFLPLSMRRSTVQRENCYWGHLTPCEYALLKAAVQDESNFAFAFLSESAVPVKSAKYVHAELSKDGRNLRSRFFFSNLNARVAHRHHQWVILNRRHAEVLVQAGPVHWGCKAWAAEFFSDWPHTPLLTAPDEYALFLTLQDVLGPQQAWLEVNDGLLPPPFSDTKPKQGNLTFRHTWVCWGGSFLEETEEDAARPDCRTVGLWETRWAHSPVTFHRVFADEFERQLLNDSNVWFARKFAPDCDVVPRATWEAKGETEVKGSEARWPMSLEEWLESVGAWR